MYWTDSNLIEMLKNNGVVVMPTDTIYGIVGRALNSATVNRIYEIRKRASNKPCIILIGDINELEKFSIHLSEKQKKVTNEYWPGSFGQKHAFSQFPASQRQHSKKYVSASRPVSIIFSCESEEFKYLHRGTKTLAFRLPAQEELRKLLIKTGPLIAPSANLEGLPSTRNITEAKNYFGQAVDLYIDGGELEGKPSKLIKLHKDGTESIIRE